MPKQRSVFSEYWYRVANLCPKLMPATKIKKQLFRGREWMVIQSPLNVEYFRLHMAAYGFIALLDGRRTVSQAWEISNKRFADQAVTQGEAIQLMGMLYQSNLLTANLSPDTEELFKRFKKRRNREIKNIFLSVLFPKFPVFYPDIFLGRWLPLFSWCFKPIGFFIFFALLIIGAYSLIGSSDKLLNSSSGILSVNNLPWLYLAFILSKVFHELASAFASKYYGRCEGDSGEVREAGIMLIILAPAPYIDTSGIWGLREKKHRILAGASGILGELILAAISAIVWGNSAEASVLHSLSYNLMFIACVSTLLFNGNPLLKYDSYYILCDLCEIPNLASRSQQYILYIVKKYVWKVKGISSPAHSNFEQLLFFIYGIVSICYRMLILSGILLIVADLAFVLGVILAIVFFFLWFVLPVFKFIRYLFLNGELAQVRSRAIFITFTIVLAVFFIVAVIPIPDRFHLEAVVEAEKYHKVYAKTDGYITYIKPHCWKIDNLEFPVAQLSNNLLRAEGEVVKKKIKEAELQLKKAEIQETAEMQIWSFHLDALLSEKQRIDSKIKDLDIMPPITGIWSSPEFSCYSNKFVKHGELIGEIIDNNVLIIRANIKQEGVAIILQQVRDEVEIKVKNRPDLELKGRIIAIYPAGKKHLSSPALSIHAGGETKTDPTDNQGIISSEHFFEIIIVPLEDSNFHLKPGQVLTIRFSTDYKPIWLQAKRALLQIFQKRFNI